MENSKKKYTKKKEEPLLGKVAPHDAELEQAVLGALMLESKSIIQVVDLLNEETFYKEEHSIVYKAIFNLFKRSEKIDILTVSNEVKSLGHSDRITPYFVASLTDRVASAHNIDLHSKILAQFKLKRDIAMLAGNTIQRSFDESIDSFDLLDKLQTDVNSVAGGFVRGREKQFKDVFKKFMDNLEKLAYSDGSITGVPTTINALNHFIGGWQNSDLIIVAGRPGAGKTAFTKACVRGIIEIMNEPVLVFSLEMSALQILERFIAEDVTVNSREFKNSSFTRHTDIFNRINEAARKYEEKLIIDDTSGLTINELKARAKRIYSEKKFKAIIVDYLQLVAGGADTKGQNKTNEMGYVSNNLKQLAKDLDVPVIALSQLNRLVEQRNPPRPILSDLRDSGSIEQDADIVCFLYRPEYYKIETIEDGSSSKGYAELLVEKNRSGAIGTVKMRFTDYLTKFSDWNDYTPPPNNISTTTQEKPLGNLKPNTDFDVPF